MDDNLLKPEKFRLLLFNPETDYALACGDSFYCAPARIRQFRENMSLFPAIYAAPGDTIIVPDEVWERKKLNPSHLQTAESKKLNIIPYSYLHEVANRNPTTDIRLLPWGWNHTLRHQLLKSGMPEEIIPDKKFIDTLRNLSHRRLSVTARKKLYTNVCIVPATAEIYTLNDAEYFIKQYGITYFKLPWSSSGRGVVRSDSLSPDKLRQWISGGIRTQGSVMAEKALNGKADFASEWLIEDRQVKFIGMSFFSTTNGGRYGQNIFAPQKQILKNIIECAPEWNNDILDAQRELITDLIAPDYNGPLGIDMLVTADGNICPFIEHNLRMTMGIAAIWANQYKNV